MKKYIVSDKTDLHGRRQEEEEDDSHGDRPEHVHLKNRRDIRERLRYEEGGEREGERAHEQPPPTPSGKN